MISKKTQLDQNFDQLAQLFMNMNYLSSAQTNSKSWDYLFFWAELKIDQKIVNSNSRARMVVFRIGKRHHFRRRFELRRFRQKQKSSFVDCLQKPLRRVQSCKTEFWRSRFKISFRKSRNEIGRNFDDERKICEKIWRYKISDVSLFFRFVALFVENVNF